MKAPTPKSSSQRNSAATSDMYLRIELCCAAVPTLRHRRPFMNLTGFVVVRLYNCQTLVFSNSYSWITCVMRWSYPAGWPLLLKPVNQRSWTYCGCMRHYLFCYANCHWQCVRWTCWIASKGNTLLWNLTKVCQFVDVQRIPAWLPFFQVLVWIFLYGILRGRPWLQITLYG